jgi:hypothetical protein
LILRLFVPAVAVVSLIVALILVSRNAVPGESLYPVRGALKKVGLATAPVKEVNREIRLARDLLISAEAALDDPERATDLAFEAVSHLRDARELLGDLDPLDRARRDNRIDVLEQRAATVIAYAQAADLKDAGDDGSGSGSGDDDSDDDNSGSGSGDDSDDDSSGPGSGDDSDGDSSGSGSGDSDDDSSGPGSGDDSDGDSSGSGSSGSGSGGDSSGEG